MWWLRVQEPASGWSAKRKRRSLLCQRHVLAACKQARNVLYAVLSIMTKSTSATNVNAMCQTGISWNRLFSLVGRFDDQFGSNVSTIPYRECLPLCCAIQRMICLQIHVHIGDSTRGICAEADEPTDLAASCDRQLFRPMMLRLVVIAGSVFATSIGIRLR